MHIDILRRASRRLFCERSKRTETDGSMDGKNLGTLARLSTVLLLTLTPACGPESSTGPSGTGAGTGTGGAGTGGDNGGTSSGGTSSGSGGTSSGSGGASSGSGGTSSGGGSAGGGTTLGSGGASLGSGGTSSATGGTSTGRGGSSASGGTRPSRGGTSSSGGSTGSGGTTLGSGGTGTGGATPGTGGTSGNTSTFTVNVELSSAVPTVGIATWSLGASIDSATIDFGRDQSNFELQAPADLAADNHRTLLLGMKPSTTYYVRVTASGGGQTYVSQVATIKTGLLANGLPVPTVTDTSASALYAGGGFTTACMGYTMMGGPGSGSTAVFTFDRDGDLVWAYDLSNTVGATCTRARMSLDGKYMWVGNFGNTTTDGALMRISMDGLGTPDVFNHPGRSHDFAVLPDDHIIYFARDDGGAGMTPESIYELDPATGTHKLIYSELTDYGDVFDSRGGHTNQVNYVPELNAVSFSMYFINTIALISYPEGKLLASFGGNKSTFPNMSWNGQHGHDVYADHIDVFNNNGKNGGSSVRRFQYDLQAKTATELSDYSSGLSSQAFGDVKELPNGNYFVTYSTAGVVHEIDSSLKLLREVDVGTSIGYTEHRGTLYGKPPPYTE
jgi:hypothetical protein